MASKINNEISLKSAFDSHFCEFERLPRRFTINFDSFVVKDKWKTRISFEGIQIGDVIDDNAKNSDYYRFHDIFHFSFATLLGWSPCTRAMMKRKRKSDPEVDEHEDGARATITEEALSMIIFNEAKRKNYFENVSHVSKATLRIIKEMTENFEVNVRTSKEWETAILKAYDVFRLLKANQGGKVTFDAVNHGVSYCASSSNGRSATVVN